MFNVFAAFVIPRFKGNCVAKASFVTEERGSKAEEAEEWFYPAATYYSICSVEVAHYTVLRGAKLKSGSIERLN